MTGFRRVSVPLTTRCPGRWRRGGVAGEEAQKAQRAQNRRRSVSQGHGARTQRKPETGGRGGPCAPRAADRRRTGTESDFVTEQETDGPTDGGRRKEESGGQRTEDGISRKEAQNRIRYPPAFRRPGAFAVGHGRRPFSLGKARWCPGADSNRYTLRHRLLRPACLPIPPPGQGGTQTTRGADGLGKHKMHPPASLRRIGAP